MFRKGRKEDLGSYRAVSLTSLPVKITEQIPMEAILRHMQEKMIQESQHGFTKGRSCLTNLGLSVMEELHPSTRGHQPMSFTYLTFLKTFGMIPHGIIISKLEIHRFDGWTIWETATWPESYDQWLCVQWETSDN